MLGPAMTDAAACYEAADFVGVIASPSCSDVLDSMARPGPAAFVRLEVPPLRERLDDLPLLVGQILARLNAKLGYRRLPGWLAWEKMRTGNI